MQIAESQSNSNIIRPNTQYFEPKKDKYSAKLAILMQDDSQTPMKSHWKTLKDSIKVGKESPCTQSEIAMGQCH